MYIWYKWSKYINQSQRLVECIKYCDPTVWYPEETYVNIMITEYERERLQKDKVNISQQKPEVNILIKG